MKNQELNSVKLYHVLAIHCIFSKKSINLVFFVYYKLTEKSLKDRLRYVTVLIKGEMSGISAMKCA